MEKRIIVKKDTGRRNRRIDLFIQTQNRLIPFEVKVNASDREDQCSDYYEHALKKNKGDKRITKLYYLTKYGTKPSDPGAETLCKAREIILLSFEEHIKNWLEECIDYLKDKNKPVIIRKNLEQFLLAIRNITGQEENIPMKFTTQDELECAVEIAKTLKNCKPEACSIYFEKLDERIESKYPGELERLPNNGDLKKTSDYLDDNKWKKSYLGTNFKIKKQKKIDYPEDGLELILRIQLENGGEVVAGVHLAELKQNDRKLENWKLVECKDQKTSDEIKENFPSTAALKSTVYFPFYEFIEYEGKILRFGDNEEYYSLLIDENREKIIDQTLASVEKILDCFRENLPTKVDGFVELVDNETSV